MEKLSYLTAISPIDGRYNKQVSQLRTIFSEFGLLKLRVQIEIRWLQQLSMCKDITEVPIFDSSINNFLNDIIINFNEQDALNIKHIENTTKHDMKAVEYFLKDKIKNIPVLKSINEFIHFACTSEDINNLAHAMMLSTTRSDIVLPMWHQIINDIVKLANRYRNIPLLSRTHGQPATPSTLGKEMANIAYRLSKQYFQLKKINILGKMNGTVGNYNAHKIVYPEVDWLSFNKAFVNSFGIDWNPYTTQIEPHDYIAELFHCIIRFNTIIIDFNRDVWGYMALGYLEQYSITGEIGSSIMPHKINPIYFENAEGNLDLSNAILQHLSLKLPISRWQRDLTDSTMLRNLGVGISYALIAYQATLNGIIRIKINKKNISRALDCAWEILAEPIQMVMRRYGIKNSYEKLQQFTCGKEINMNDIKMFVNNLPLPEHEKIKLKKLTPENYIGYATILVDELSLNIPK